MVDVKLGHPSVIDLTAKCPNFTFTGPCLKCLCLLNRFLNVKALMGAFNKEKAHVRTFSEYCATSFNIANRYLQLWVARGGGGGGCY